MEVEGGRIVTIDYQYTRLTCWCTYGYMGPIANGRLFTVYSVSLSLTLYIHIYNCMVH